MQTITHLVRIDSNNHGTTAENPAPALVMGQATEYAINLIDENNQPFDPPNIGGVEEWRFVLAGDFNQSTPNCLTTSARYAGDGWFYADVSESWTAEMVSYLGGAEYKPIQAEIIGIGSAGETKDDWVFQFQTYIRNRVDAIGHDAPSAVTPYITSADLAEERAEYLEPILSGVESISGTVGTLATSAQANAIQAAIGNTPYGSIADHLAAVNINLGDTAATLATSAQATAIQSTLNNSTNGLSAIKTRVGEVYQYLDGMIYGNVCDASTYSRQNNEELTNQNYGLSAIKTTVDSLATSAQAATILNYVDGIQQVATGTYSSLNSGVGAIIDSQTFGLVQLTNKVAAIQSTLNDSTNGLSAIKTAVEAGAAVSPEQKMSIAIHQNLGDVPSPVTITFPTGQSYTAWTGRFCCGVLPKTAKFYAAQGSLPWGSTGPSNLFQYCSGVELFKIQVDNLTTSFSIGGASSYVNMVHLRKIWVESLGGHIGWGNSNGVTLIGGWLGSPVLKAVCLKGRVLISVLFSNTSGAQSPNLEYVDASQSQSTATSQSLTVPQASFPKLKVVRLANPSALGNLIQFLPALQILDFRTRTVTTIPSVTYSASAACENVKVVVPDSLKTNWEANSAWANYVSNKNWQIVAASEYTGDDYSNYDWEGLDTL